MAAPIEVVLPRWTPAEVPSLEQAQRTRGSFDLWSERFGKPVARLWRTTRTETWFGMILAGATLLGFLGGGIAAYILDMLGHPSALTVFTGSILPLALILVASLVVIVVARYGRRGKNAIAKALLAALIDRDPTLTRDRVEGLIVRPYLYDLWVQRHAAGE